ncbi:MAG: hypothetical protein CMB77_04310 [Euryarchaeota archaeon]|nr:hypothetical protein [Euryarchaeota archaeon]
MAVFKSLLNNDVKTTKSILNQLVDIVREDVSGSNSRKSYEVFVTSSYGPGVTSSLYQTVFDQDFSLQTSNSLFDITFGFYPESTEAKEPTTAPGAFITEDTAGKRRYKHTSLMMREKQDIYKQFAATLLGNPTAVFKAPYSMDTSTTVGNINAALFISLHRLFVRDGIKRETFAMRMNYHINNALGTGGTFTDNLFQIMGNTERIYTDFGSSTNRPTAVGGEVGNIVYASDTSQVVGLIFYDHGTIVLDVEKVFSKTDIGHGKIDAMTAAASSGSAGSVYSAAGAIPRGKALFGPPLKTAGGALTFGANGPGDATIPASAITAGGTMWPYFWTSGSIDNIVDHICVTRFGSDAGTAITFQNATEINSTIYFIRAQPDEFNYSSNPTYVASNGQIIVTDDSVNSLSKPFSYITTVGLYGDYDDLLAVAKVSRPIEKNDEKDLTIRVRLDF